MGLAGGPSLPQLRCVWPPLQRKCVHPFETELGETLLARLNKKEEELMNHTIEVRLQPGPPELVSADPNPLPRRPPPEVRVGPGDTVTWLFDAATVGNRELQVYFQLVVALHPVTGLPMGDPQPCNPLGPFTSLSLGARTIVGTVRSDVSQDINQAKRFIYKVVENGVPLQWAQLVPGGDAINGGGIDNPRTPP